MSLINSDSKIAGVTFANDILDGGESRQVLLQGLYGKPTIVSLAHCKFMGENGEEDAIKVISDVTGKVLGFVPREDINKLWPYDKMVLNVTKYRNTYSGKLSIPQAPSAKQYAFLKAKREAGEIAEMPAYDKTIYQHVISMING